MNNSLRLDEVTLMRCILAALIVFMHSFTCYNGGWPEPIGYKDVLVYKWISRLSFAFTLQAFVFISGYLFAFQRISLRRTGCSFIIKKIKRLILPSIIFSALYFPLFYEYKGLINLVYNLINGCGHMWFLPMLFWCFIGGWLCEQVRIGDGWKLSFLFLLTVFWFKSLPLQLGRAISYMFYFYLGYVVFKHSGKIKQYLKTDIIAFFWIIFLVLFILLRPLRDSLTIDDSFSLLRKAVIIVTDNLCVVLYATVGSLAFYLSAVYYTRKRQLKTLTVMISSCCFGIYLFQQFILRYLYYKTPFPEKVGPYWLPWCGFTIAIFFSFSLSFFALRTKIGRALIG